MDLLPHREPWREHPHFPAQVLLLESHDAFAEMAKAFQARVASIASGEGLSERQVVRFASRLADEFRVWQWSMRCHERYEENRLYPFLGQRFAVACQDLAGDHARLHDLADRCASALSEAAEAARDSGVFREAAVGQVLGDYLAELERHLIAEEQRVIPLLLSLSAREFESYHTGESCGIPGPGDEQHQSA